MESVAYRRARERWSLDQQKAIIISTRHPESTMVFVQGKSTYSKLLATTCLLASIAVSYTCGVYVGLSSDPTSCERWRQHAIR